jgi:hypothetical protein
LRHLAHLALVLFLLTGCAAQTASVEPPRTREEAYLYARSGYEVALEQMVAFRDECFARPPELVAECRPTVERLRRIAKDGMTYRDVLEVAYRNGDVRTFEGSLNGLKTIQAALKNELIRETAVSTHAPTTER